MLLLFKGQLSLEDIMSFPYKRLCELKESREHRMLEEQEEIEKMQVEQERQQIRNTIMQN